MLVFFALICSHLPSRSKASVNHDGARAAEGAKMPAPALLLLPGIAELHPSI